MCVCVHVQLVKDAAREAAFLEAKLDRRELRRRRAEAAKERAEASDRVMRLLQVFSLRFFLAFY